MSSVGPSKSYDHVCTKLPSGTYHISWTIDLTGRGRLRFPVRRSSYTSAAGARRFCKKWGLPLPE